MEQLKKALRQHGIDAASLDILVEQSDERIYLLTTSGADAVLLWHKFRGLVNDIRHWPVILGTDLSLWNHRRRLEELRHVSAHDIIARGLQIDPISWLVQRAKLDHYPDDQWFAARLEHIRTAMNNHLRSLGYTDDEMWDPWQIETEDAANPLLLRQPHTFAIPTEIVSTAPEADQASNSLLPWQPWHVQTHIRRPAAKVHLGLLPTTSGWHIPALLKSISGYYSPEPEEHVALWKRWSELYGAEVVGVDGASVEFRVSQLPTDRSSALRIAWEHLTYCPDINEPLDSYAAKLLRDTVWSFWWD